jgi:PleD family two-component response regulator
VEADNAIARKIRERVEWGFEEGGGVTASVGAATYSKEMDVNDFVALVDKNLYKAKRQA